MKTRMLFAACALSFTTILSGCQKAEVAQAVDRTVTMAGETVTIEVASNGYTPKTIGVKKGQAVRLAFLRKDKDNCGEELVFPTLNIRKELPVGKTVEVDITPDSTGELKFSCGMDMLRGKLIVTE